MFQGKKLGLNIPSPERIAAIPNLLKFAASTPGLPLIADSTDYGKLLPKGLWGMLGNDQYGDCFWAAVANSLMAQQTNAGSPVHVYTTQDVLAWYSAATGFKQSDPNTDQGTDPIQGMQWLQQKGLIEAWGQIPITGNDAHLAAGINLFGGCILGVQVPSGWMSSTTWGPNAGPVEGGHAIVGAGYNEGCDIQCLTWAETVKLLNAGKNQYGMVAIVVVTKQLLESNGQTLQGFDLTGLKAELATVA